MHPSCRDEQEEGHCQGLKNALGADRADLPQVEQWGLENPIFAGVPDVGLDVVLADLDKGVDPEDALDLADPFPVAAEVPEEAKDEADGVEADGTSAN